VETAPPVEGEIHLNNDDQPAPPHVTLINVFTVIPERQRELIDLLIEATEQVIQHVRGFISANIHASTDGMRVVNYAQWKNAEALQAMLADPAAQRHTSTAAAIASYDPHLYTVELPARGPFVGDLLHGGYFPLIRDAAR
jgi:quinol monooxygenase YgiN